MAEIEQRRWRIDLRVFPMLFTLFGVSVLDRTNISAAYIAGMNEDIALAEGYVQSTCPRFVYQSLTSATQFSLFNQPAGFLYW
jgi:hypothetical protein